jgi:hypothetical protein
MSDLMTRAADDTVAQVTARVEALLQAGRPLDAIAHAVAANRASPSAELERCLVGWRMDAYARLPHGPGRPDWPPEYADPFPGMDGLPAIDAADLTAEILGGAILHHGALWIRGLVDPDEAARLRAGIESARVARDLYHGDGAEEGGDAWYSPVPGRHVAPEQRRWVELGDGVRTTDSPRFTFALIELFERQGLIDVIAEFLGERPALSVLKSTLRRVNPDAGTDWHQDGAFLGAHVRSVNVWLGLSDCGEDAPGLDLVGRRVPYVLQTGSHGSIFDWAVGPGIVDTLAQAGAPVLSPVFAAGDAVLFDHLMLHRTGVRPGMTKSRWAVESWFFAPSAYPMEQVPVVV